MQVEGSTEIGFSDVASLSGRKEDSVAKWKGLRRQERMNGNPYEWVCAVNLIAVHLHGLEI